MFCKCSIIALRSRPVARLQDLGGTKYIFMGKDFYFHYIVKIIFSRHTKFGESQKNLRELSANVPVAAGLLRSTLPTASNY